MAGEWVKMRAALFKNPKVLSIAKVVRKEPALARMLDGADNAVTNRVTLDVTVASLLRVWSSASEFVKNGETLRGVTLEDLDVIAEVAGFGQAMAAVGWAVYDPAAGAVILPNFDEYNVSAEDRAKTPAQRSADYRARKRARARHENRDGSRDDLRDEKRDASRQKRREEKSLTTVPVGTAAPPAETDLATSAVPTDVGTDPPKPPPPEKPTPPKKSWATDRHDELMSIVDGLTFSKSMPLLNSLKKQFTKDVVEQVIREACERGDRILVEKLWAVMTARCKQRREKPPVQRQQTFGQTMPVADKFSHGMENID